MKYLPEIIAFVSGAVVMILELDGSRIIAPYLGTSTIVWTGLIGVILGSLSCGYWWGGKIADKSADFGTLGKILAAAGVCVLSAVYLKSLLALATFIFGNLIIATLVGTVLSFTPATVFLGMVTPYVARLKMKNLETSGQTIGALYALSTLGSIVGTFLGGFFLISFLGSTKIITVLSATLFILAAAAFFKNEPKEKVLALACLFLALFTLTLKPAPDFGNQVIKDIDTRYSRVWIYDTLDAPSKRPVRYMTNTVYGTQSGSFLDKPEELLFPYTKLFDLAAKLRPNFRKALMIGAGAYSYPKHFIATYPKAYLDVVEIDPELTILAQQYFGFKENPRVNIVHEDGRTFLNKNRSRYDIIWNDAFLSHLNIPFQLATREAVEQMYASLDEKGIVMSNMIAAASGPKSKFLQAEYATYKKVFPAVYAIKVTDRADTDIQNIMLVAFKAYEARIPSSPSGMIFENISEKNLFVPNVEAGIPILSDEFAPIEKYLTSMLL